MRTETKKTTPGKRSERIANRLRGGGIRPERRETRKRKLKEKGRKEKREKKKRRGGGGGVKEKRIPDMLQKMEGRKKKKGNRQDWVGHAIPVMLQGGAGRRGFFHSGCRRILQRGNFNCNVFYILQILFCGGVPESRETTAVSLRIHT